MYMYMNSYFSGAEKWFLVMCRNDSQDHCVSPFDSLGQQVKYKVSFRQ